MGTQCDSATLPDAVSPFFKDGRQWSLDGRRCLLSVGADSPGRPSRLSRMKSEDLPFAESKMRPRDYGRGNTFVYIRNRRRMPCGRSCLCLYACTSDTKWRGAGLHLDGTVALHKHNDYEALPVYHHVGGGGVMRHGLRQHVAVS